MEFVNDANRYDAELYFTFEVTTYKGASNIVYLPKKWGLRVKDVYTMTAARLGTDDWFTIDVRIVNKASATAFVLPSKLVDAKQGDVFVAKFRYAYSLAGGNDARRIRVQEEDQEPAE